MENTAKVHKGATVAVFGAGVIGLAVIEVLKQCFTVLEQLHGQDSCLPAAAPHVCLRLSLLSNDLFRWSACGSLLACRLISLVSKPFFSRRAVLDARN